MIVVTRIYLLVVLTGGLLLAVPFSAPAQGASPSSSRYWKVVEDALGRPGTPNPGGVVRFGFPRSDLSVVLHGVTLKPAFALGSWVAFQRIGDHAMAMGDLVLLDDEVESVMASLQQNGIEQTALHNHLVEESPHVMYMHIRAIGNPGRIARAVRTALEFTKTPLTPAAAAPSTPLDLDTAAIAKIIGVGGKVNGGVYQLTIPRREKIKHDKMEIPAAMGISTAINFQSTGAGKAAITGDFVLLGREVNSVIWALSEAGIQVTALHSHMIGEEPRLF
ncbi:MAG: DUF1259 domain-containing protein, partial [Gemmatimonadota bacterium]|nr:DUF1259 domain-containing protein [Gemmatimonadota bacterium]